VSSSAAGAGRRPGSSRRARVGDLLPRYVRQRLRQFDGDGRDGRVHASQSSAAEDMVKPSAAARRRSRPVSSVIARARGRRSHRRGGDRVVPVAYGRSTSRLQEHRSWVGTGRRAGASPPTTPPPRSTSLRACPTASPSAAPSRPTTPPPSSTSPNTRSNETAHREPLRDYCAAALGGVDKVARGRWGGWGSNPRPADYEKYGFVHCAR
jgi:hypothetical protein